MDTINSLPLDVAGPWSACLAAFARDLSAQQYATWIRPLRCEAAGPGLRVLAPNRFVLQWVKERFGVQIEAVASDASGRPVPVEFALAPDEGPRVAAPRPAPEAAAEAPAAPPKGAAPASRRPDAPPDATSLNRALTFDSFVDRKSVV